MRLLQQLQLVVIAAKRCVPGVRPERFFNSGPGIVDCHFALIRNVGERVIDGGELVHGQIGHRVVAAINAPFGEIPHHTLLAARTRRRNRVRRDIVVADSAGGGRRGDSRTCGR